MTPRPVSLTHEAALELAERAIGFPPLDSGTLLLMRERIAQTLLAVDLAARQPAHDEKTCHVCASNREKEA